MSSWGRSILHIVFGPVGYLPLLYAPNFNQGTHLRLITHARAVSVIYMYNRAANIHDDQIIIQLALRPGIRQLKFGVAYMLIGIPAEENMTYLTHRPRAFRHPFPKLGKGIVILGSNSIQVSCFKGKLHILCVLWCR